jgi:hypothetical protein
MDLNAPEDQCKVFVDAAVKHVIDKMIIIRIISVINITNVIYVIKTFKLHFRFG